MSTPTEPRIANPKDDPVRSTGIIVFSIAVAFGTYFCMYAFRKPFSAAEYSGLQFFGTEITLKTILVISQILGYATSKYIGIKVCSEISRKQRPYALVGLILLAEFALLLFAVLPQDWKFLALFLNGLPLGMVWGLVVWYLEGRRTSELLLAGLSCSYIMASGVVKDIGRWLMRDHGVPEFWMPFATGLVFLIPYLVFVFLLTWIPQPNSQDIDERTERATMNGSRRWAFLNEFFFGLAVLFLIYFFLTAFRDIRDNFGQELWSELGYGKTPGKFTMSETLVAFGCMFVFSLLAIVKNNKVGLFLAFLIITVGLLLLAGGTLLFDAGYVDGFAWMVMIGFGAYLAYVPFGSMLFDRIIASTRVVATSVFAIYAADAIGYTGSVGLTIYKDLGMGGDFTYLNFFRYFSYGMAIFGSLLTIISGIYFLRLSKDQPQLLPKTPTSDAAVLSPIPSMPASESPGSIQEKQSIHPT
ncbi:MAG: DUF5690 family protein [Gemmataceae bacterium]